MLGPEDLLELTPQMTFRLQPYITLLALQYAVDDLHLKVSELAEGHGEASNAMLRHRERRTVRRFSLQREDIYLAVHRVNEWVYFRRLETDEFRLLDALRGGRPVGEAIDSIFGRDYPVIVAIVLLFTVFYALINLGVDLLYAAIDPRIRLQ